ncbi:palmitoyltransferase ZDHHC17-like isoform X2 [Anguilla rostrata]|uniref:palmitoyltransferase ZDHHC17-like isoform X2 n=1 Tax=Anguilla rostrata TaxID=7938 RepID=UPI0030D2E8C8
MVPAPRPPSLTLSGQYEQCSGTGHCFKPPVDNVDIFQAAKLGQLEECRRVVSAEGAGVLHRVDCSGHTPAHWASLAGAVDIVQFILETGGPVDLPGVGEQAQRPVHWAALNGHIAVVDLLLGAGVSMDTADHRGYTPLILAAQYGHTALCCYLIGKGAQLHLCDAEGDNALHWAAFKGHCELTRLLIYSGFNPKQPDKIGQTPLHLAVLSGDLLTVQLLCEQCIGVWPTWKIQGPCAFPVILPVPLGIPHLPVQASLMDPGFLPRDSKEYDQAIRQAVHCEGWRQGRNPLLRLCHTCHIVRPLRTKHCRVTNRCVEHFDHYCPYIYNTVGRRNRTYFLGFLSSMSLNCFMGVYLCVDWFSQMGRSLFIGAGFLFMAIIGVISGIMACICLHMAALNTTTNEQLNHHKYSYLREEEGQAASLFDRGVLLNLLEFFHMVPSLQEGQLRTMDYLQVI